MSPKFVSVVATAVALQCAAEACSTFMVNPDIAQGSAVSARTMDFSKIDLNTTVNIVPAGSTLWSGMLNDDLTGSAAGDVNKQGLLDFPQSTDKRMYYKSKYGFVATQQHIYANTIQPLMGSALNATNTFGDMLFSAVSDGLNEKGLSCAMLFDSSLQESLNGSYYAFNTSDTQRPNAHTVYQICKHILSSYASADEAVADLSTQTTQVFSPKTFITHKIFFPMHIIVMDSHHQVWVMEFKNKTSDSDGYVWKNATRWGVVTNQPQYEEQIANLESYIAGSKLNQKFLAQLNASTPDIGPEFKSMFPDFPGTFSSKDRFTRLALLNKLAPLAPQPAAVMSFMPPAAMNKPAVTAALLNVNSVTLPTAGVLEQGTQEVTLWRVIRDHANAALYFQSYADLVWGYVDVAEVIADKAPLTEQKTGTSASARGFDAYAIPLNMGKFDHTAINMASAFV